MVKSAKVTLEQDAKRNKRTGLTYQEYNPHPKNKQVRDCAVRAIVKVTGESYESVYKELKERTEKFKRRKCNLDTYGVPTAVIRSFFQSRGWKWIESKGPMVEEVRRTRCARIVSRRRKKVLFKADSIPPKPCVVLTSTHAVAVVNHVVYDTWDTRGDRSREMMGYFIKK